MDRDGRHFGLPPVQPNLGIYSKLQKIPITGISGERKGGRGRGGCKVEKELQLEFDLAFSLTSSEP